MDAIGNLRHLVERGFQGAPVHNDVGDLDALMYVRHWPAGVVDVVIVYSHEEAFAYRASGIDPDASLLNFPARVHWRQAGHPDSVTTAVLGLDEP
ncbi:hypothetical protein GCM10027271_28580 [Saccharopolyspora gloriosae]|uniref:Uncharacterized protein n=1 Tax=Saccharopolyspora gloriosae TaxID=455344 RepID=A0A840NSY7_9PSEU|nr:hypothetical protein [Saccharopolyspora gloriosae]MBB5071307.1 hypothetical protein [Saccharopolyspora gloriosae]